MMWPQVREECVVTLKYTCAKGRYNLAFGGRRSFVGRAHIIDLILPSTRSRPIAAPPTHHRQTASQRRSHTSISRRDRCAPIQIESPQALQPRAKTPKAVEKDIERRPYTSSAACVPFLQRGIASFAQIARAQAAEFSLKSCTDDAFPSHRARTTHICACTIPATVA